MLRCGREEGTLLQCDNCMPSLLKYECCMARKRRVLALFEKPL